MWLEQVVVGLVWVTLVPLALVVEGPALWLKPEVVGQVLWLEPVWPTVPEAGIEGVVALAL